MSKYSSSTIYKGNLMKYEDGKSTLYKENIDLIYDENRDVFYSFLEVFNLILSNKLDDLSKEKREANQKVIDKYTYSYIHTGKNGEVYIDENSIKISLISENKKSRLN